MNNGGAGTTTETIIRDNTAGLGLPIWTNTWAYFYMECDDRNDQFITKVWFGTTDGAPTGNPTHTDTIPFSAVAPASGTSMRYHNVINNEAAIDEYLDIAEVTYPK